MWMKRPWLKPYDWEAVVITNSGLCAQKAAMHKPTSDGYEQVKALWMAEHGLETDVREALALCRRAHRGGPFVYFNGNTFASIARLALQPLLSSLPEQEAKLLRSQAGHYVAGVVSLSELEAVLDRLLPPPSPST